MENRAEDRICDVLGTYDGAGLQPLLTDGGSLVVLVILTVKPRLYDRVRLAQLAATGRI